MIKMALDPDKMIDDDLNGEQGREDEEWEDEEEEWEDEEEEEEEGKKEEEEVREVESEELNQLNRMLVWLFR